MEAGGQFLVPTKGRGRSSNVAEGPKWLSDGDQWMMLLSLSSKKKKQNRKHKNAEQRGESLIC